MTQGSIVPFQFEDHEIRAMQLGGEPWFVAKDIATVLGYANPQKAVRDHCKRAMPIGGEPIVHPYELDPQTVIIPEPDVYRLIMRSRLPKAEKFEEWVVSEVLPQIRKTGSYNAKPEKLPTNFDAIRALVDAAEAHEIRLKKVEGAIENFGAHEDYRSIKAHAALTNVKITSKEAQSLGQQASALSRQRNLVIGEQPDNAFGKVGTYHLDILAIVFGEFVKLPKTTKEKP